MDALRNTINTQSIKTKQIVFQYPDGSFPEPGAILTVTDTRGHTAWINDPALDAITLVDASGNEGTLTYTDVSGLLVNGVPVGGGGGGGTVTAGSNISITGGWTNTVNVDVTSTLDMNKQLLKNADTIEMGRTTDTVNPLLQMNMPAIGPGNNATIRMTDGVTAAEIRSDAASGGAPLHLVASTIRQTVDSRVEVASTTGDSYTLYSDITANNVFVGYKNDVGVVESNREIMINAENLLSSQVVATLGNSEFKIQNGTSTPTVRIDGGDAITQIKSDGSAKLSSITFQDNNATPVFVKAEFDSVAQQLTISGTNTSSAYEVSTKLDTRLHDYTNTAGIAGQVLTSQGPVLPPVWADTTGGGGGTEWIDTYLISQPPVPENVANPNETSSEILIRWDLNPAQISVSFMPNKLPRIAYLKVTVDSVTYTNTANLPGVASEMDAVKGVALIIGTGSNGIVVRDSVNVFAIYLASAPVSPFSVDIWYEGDGATPVNKLTIDNLSFAAGSGPSVPLTIVVYTSSGSFGNVDITFTEPQYSDNVAMLPPQSPIYPSNPSIISYTATYTPNSSIWRYGGPANTIQRTKTTTGSPLTISASGGDNLLHDTVYNYTLYATNSLNLDGESAIGTFTTGPKLSLEPLNSRIQYTNLIALFSPFKYVATPIFINTNNATPLSNPVLNTGTPGTVTFGTLPIHLLESRGSTDDSIMTFSLSAAPSSGPPITDSISVGGFGKTTAGSGGSFSLTPVVNSRTDVGAVLADQGFYQRESYTAVLPSSLTPGQSYALTATQTFSASASSSASVYNFYSDNFDKSTTPVVTITSASVNPSGTTTTFISGLPVTSVVNLSGLTYSISGLSNYFTTSGTLKYSLANMLNVTLIDKISSVLSSNTYNATNTGLNVGSVSGYYLSPSFSLVAKNINNNANLPVYIQIDILVDSLSLSKNGSVQRYRSPLAAVKTSTNSADYTPELYDNSIALTTSGYTHESMLHRGLFVGKGYISGGITAFTNYTAVGGANLTNVSGSGGFTDGYRYVTFQTIGGSGAVSNLTLTINFSGSATLSTAAISTRLKLQANGADVDVFFRTVGDIESRWINANSYENGDNLGIYYPISQAGTPLGVQKEISKSGLTISGTQVVYNLFIPTPFSATNTYVCIGIPDSANIGVDTINCNYNTNFS